MIEARCPLHDRPTRATVGLLCRTHYDRLERQLAELPAVVGWLAANLAAGGAAAGDRVSGSREDPIPLRLGILSLIGPVAAGRVPAGEDQDCTGHIPTVLASWAALVAEERALRPPRQAVAALAAFLGCHLPWAAAQPWIDELVAEVADLTAQAHRVAPWRPGAHRLPAPCPACDTLALVRHDGADVVTCDSRAGGCGVRWTEGDYQRLCMMLAADAKEEIA